jgi:hypothetical protein
MLFELVRCLCFLFLSLNLINPALAQSQSTKQQDVSRFDELAAALDKTTTEEEIEKLLAEEKELVGANLVDALYRLGVRKINDNNSPQALRLANILLQFAAHPGDSTGKASALSLQGSVHLSQGRF